MNVQDILWGPLGARLAWTLLHFLWQGLLVGAGVAALGWLLPKAQARGRYAVALAGLVLMACCPLITFAVLEVSAPSAVAVAPAAELPEPAPPAPEPIQAPAAESLLPQPSPLPDVAAAAPPVTVDAEPSPLPPPRRV